MLRCQFGISRKRKMSICTRGKRVIAVQKALQRKQKSYDDFTYTINITLQYLFDFLFNNKLLFNYWCIPRLEYQIRKSCSKVIRSPYKQELTTWLSKFIVAAKSKFFFALKSHQFACWPTEVYVLRGSMACRGLYVSFVEKDRLFTCTGSN